MWPITEHDISGDLRGGVSVVDRHGARTQVASGFGVIRNVVWTSDQELQFSGVDDAVENFGSLYAVRIGQEKQRFGLTAGDIIDVAPGGRALFYNYASSTTTVARRTGAPGDLDLSDRTFASYVTDISADGRSIVGTWQARAGGVNDAVYLQRTDATSPVRLGEGQALALSPDQKWVLARLVRPQGERLILVPTGAGESRELPGGEVKQYSAGKWFPEGKRVIFSGARGDAVPRLYVQDVGGGSPQPFSGNGFTLPSLGASVSPDGKRIVALGPEDEPVLFSTEGGEPMAIPHMMAGDVPIAWTSDSSALFYFEAEEPAARLRRYDLRTGKAHVVSELLAARPVGLMGHYRILVTPDGSTCIFSYSHISANLVLAEDR